MNYNNVIKSPQRRQIEQESAKVIQEDSPKGLSTPQRKRTNTLTNNVFLKGYENRRNSITDVRAIQKMLGFKGTDLDGKWGAKTEEAYQKYLGFKPSDSQQTPNPGELNVTVPNVVPKKEYLQQEQLRNATAIPQYDITSTLPSTLQIQNLPTTIPLPQSSYEQPKQYNRSEIRQYLRDKGLNPYSFTGAQRRALRYWLNGDKNGQNYDKDLLRVFGDLSQYAKQGAKLVSKNPVERFQQGRNLPTAPKAEKRFRKSSYNTTKEGNRETATITSQTFGYSRNWPYFRQPATIQRIIEGGDTAFVETPEHHIFTKVKPRTALKSGNVYVEYNPKYDKNYSLEGQANTVFNYPITPQEYETLKRRFNTAWNLAK